jgi:hypothetical protein
MAPMRVIQGTPARRRQSAIDAAYDHFRVDRQGNLVSASTLDHYHCLVGPFLDWLRDTHPRSSASTTWTSRSSAPTGWTWPRDARSGPGGPSSPPRSSTHTGC